METAINRNLWEGKARVQELKQQHDDSEPYKHCLVDGLCPPDFLRGIHDELTANMKANFKETDLFKVFQTAELGALDEQQLETDMPNLLTLRKALYSQEFRNIVQEISGCGDLIDRVDCSCNAYANSCHLLCHDDVIGTRCISYIIYLPDPDEPWTAEDGGAVEFFPVDPASIVQTEAGEQGVPVSLPTKTILPMFNSMLFFRVQPGKSYHAVQEVFSKTRPRISISGWYHTVDPPLGSDRSSLKLIMTYGDQPQPTLPLPFTPEELISIPKKTFTLTTDELSFLQDWIAPEYLTIKGMKSIQKEFIAQSSMKLSNFLLPKKINALVKYQLLLDELEGMGHGQSQLDYTKGFTDAWELIGPPHKRRYLRHTAAAASATEGEKETNTKGKKNKKDNKESNTVDVKDKKALANKIGEIMQRITSTLLASKVFAKYLMIVSTLTITGERHEVRRFRTGLDYTVAHYGIITKEPWLDATLCFVNDDQEAAERILSKSTATKATAEEGPKKKKSRAEVAPVVDEEQEEDDEEEEDYAILWEDGDVGGFECFIEADQDADSAEAAEVYRLNNTNDNVIETTAEKKTRDDEETTLLSVSACNNSLSLVLRDEGIMKFIKYVNANAPGSRWDISMEYALQPEEEGEDDEEDNDEEDEEDSEEEEDDDEDDE